MLLLNPYFLFGLIAVSIPVIIHLFNFRKFKRVFFSNVRFIKDIQLQTQKQSRIKHLIILALRILAISALVLAFAQPYIPVNENESVNNKGAAVSIFVDNSFSMEAQSKQGQMLDEARSRATEIIGAYKGSDRFQLLTNDFKGPHQRLAGIDVFSENLDQISPSPVVRNLSEVYKRQSDLLKQSGAGKLDLYMISDFQRSITDLEKIPLDTNVRIFLVPLTANPTPNIYIDSCWFDSPVHQAGRNVKLSVSIKNVSDQDYEKVPLKLAINGQQKAVSSFSLPARSETKIQLTYNDMEPGIRYGALEIVDFPIVYDDRFYFSYTVSGRIPILAIYDQRPNVFLNSLFGKDSSFAYTSVSERSVDFSGFRNYHLIVLDELSNVSSGLTEELKKFAEEGGSILLVPSETSSKEAYAEFLRTFNAPPIGSLRKGSQRIAKMNLNHPVFTDVFDVVPENIDLPAVFKWFEFGQSVRSGSEWLLRMQNGSSFLSAQAIGSGHLYVLASPLNTDASSFPQHAIFVPTLYKIALLSQSKQQLYYILGRNVRLDYYDPQTEGDQTLKISKLGGGLEFIPQQVKSGTGNGIFIHDQITEAGHYNLTDKDKTLTGIALNYDRSESDINAFNADELKKMAEHAGLTNLRIFKQNDKNLAGMIQELNVGIRLWKVFIILALVFLLAEVILLRVWK